MPQPLRSKISEQVQRNHALSLRQPARLMFPASYRRADRSQTPTLLVGELHPMVAAAAPNAVLFVQVLDDLRQPLGEVSDTRGNDASVAWPARLHHPAPRRMHHPEG
jgi:hypothetical protein